MQERTTGVRALTEQKKHGVRGGINPALKGYIKQVTFFYVECLCGIFFLTRSTEMADRDEVVNVK